MSTRQERIELIKQRDNQLRSLKLMETELQQRIAKVASLQKQWQSALLDGCGDLTVAILKYEGELIRHALENAGGSLVKAARSLNVSYQALAYIIDTRQSGLMRFRSEKRSRNAKRAEYGEVV